MRSVECAIYQQANVNTVYYTCQRELNRQKLLSEHRTTHTTLRAPS